MPISEHPVTGTIVMCDFSQGFREPEMVKRRPALVISPKIGLRAGLCTIVSLSTTVPKPKMPYHAELEIKPRLPPPYDSDKMWVKGDMIYAVGFHRLDLVRTGKDRGGKRMYRFNILTAEQMEVRACVLHGLGLHSLTKHLTKHV
jgi:mRNA interferase MazF